MWGQLDGRLTPTFLLANALTVSPSLASLSLAASQDLTIDVFDMLRVYTQNIIPIECNHNFTYTLQSILTNNTIVSTDINMIVSAIDGVDNTGSVFCARLGKIIISNILLLQSISTPLVSIVVCLWCVGGLLYKPLSNLLCLYPSPPPQANSDIEEGSAMTAATNAAAAIAAMVAAEEIAADPVGGAVVVCLLLLLLLRLLAP